MKSTKKDLQKPSNRIARCVSCSLAMFQLLYCILLSLADNVLRLFAYTALSLTEWRCHLWQKIIDFLRWKRKKKGGDPTAPSSTVTLLRLNPHRRRYTPTARPQFIYCRLCWFDGRCVQEARTYSPRYSWPAITTKSKFMESSCRLQSPLRINFWD